MKRKIIFAMICCYILVQATNLSANETDCDCSKMCCEICEVVNNS